MEDVPELIEDFVSTQNAGELRSPSPPPPCWDTEHEFEVDRVSDRRHLHGHEIEYRVHWSGFPASEATWEPESTLLEDVPELIEDFVRTQNAGAH